MILRRLGRRSAASAGIVLGALVATVLLSLRDSRDPGEMLATKLRAATPTVAVREGRIVLWERFETKVSRPPGRPLEVAGQAADAIVSHVSVSSGDTVAAGMVVAGIQGSPVVVLPGELPAYRDIGVGATGPDVAQLHGAMRAWASDASAGPGSPVPS